jgi:hypothetical protein
MFNTRYECPGEIRDDVLTKHRRIPLFHKLVLPTHTMSCSLSLFCWILDVSFKPFLVKIDDSLAVGDLRIKIVDENRETFRDVDKRIELLQVNGTSTLARQSY